ncbi:hypothetical protein ACNKHT_07760 [Shigella flexneri]
MIDEIPRTFSPAKNGVNSSLYLFVFRCAIGAGRERPATPQPPDILLGPLFNDVQNAKLFPDQKTFADAVPNSNSLMILADYRMQQNQSEFDLRHFVNVISPCRKRARNMFREGAVTANILTDLGRY